MNYCWLFTKIAAQPDLACMYGMHNNDVIIYILHKWSTMW